MACFAVPHKAHLAGAAALCTRCVLLVQNAALLSWGSVFSVDLALVCHLAVWHAAMQLVLDRTMSPQETVSQHLHAVVANALPWREQSEGAFSERLRQWLEILHIWVHA